jgi:Domain of unknown function (DUF4388)
VSLKGSLETIALPEVLQLLADTRKSGELQVSGTREGGRLWFGAGLLSGFEVGSSPDPADALFQLLRVDSGEFSFDTEAPMPEGARVPDGGAQDVHPALDTAQARLAEWVDIVSVVPSLEHNVKLVDEAPRDEVVVDRFQWSLLVAVGEGHPVQHVLDTRGLPEFDGCKALKGLVDASLVEVSEPVSPEVTAVEETSVPVDFDADHSPAVDHSIDDEPLATHLVEDGPAVAEDEPVVEAVAEAVETEEPPIDEYDAVEAHEEPFVEAGPDQAPHVDGHWDAGVDAVSEVGAVDGDAPAETSEEPATDGREAMRALLAELSPKFEEPVSAPVGEPVDGLVDRGPWTSTELEQMGGWHREDGEALIAWPDDEKASDPVAASVQDAGVAFHPGSGYDSDVAAPAATPAAGYQLADFGFPLRTDGAAESSQSENHAAVAAHAADSEQGEHDSEPEEGPQEEPAEEPMNRGLLLKFLSSVRN